MIPTATDANPQSRATTLRAEDLAPPYARTAAIGKTFEIDQTVQNLWNAIRSQDLTQAREFLETAKASLSQLGAFLDAAANQRG